MILLLYVAKEDYVDQKQSLLLFSMLKKTCFTVTIHNDNVVEGEESFQFVLFPTSSYVLFLERVTTTVTILDNDGQYNIFLYKVVILCVVVNTHRHLFLCLHYTQQCMILGMCVCKQR